MSHDEHEAPYEFICYDDTPTNIWRYDKIASGSNGFSARVEKRKGRMMRRTLVNSRMISKFNSLGLCSSVITYLIFQSRIGVEIFKVNQESGSLSIDHIKKMVPPSYARHIFARDFAGICSSPSRRRPINEYKQELLSQIERDPKEGMQISARPIFSMG